MQVTETLSEGLRREYAIVVPAADIEGKRTAKLAEIGRTVRLPGFRPGKVPLNLVRQRYGTAVMSEVLQDTVNAATQQVLTDRGLRPAGQPKIAVTQVADAQDLQFNVEVELLPEIARVTDKLAILRSIVGLRDEHSSWQNLTGYPMSQAQREGKVPKALLAHMMGTSEMMLDRNYTDLNAADAMDAAKRARGE